MPSCFLFEPLDRTLYSGASIDPITPDWGSLPYNIEKYAVESDQDEEMSDDDDEEDDAKAIEQDMDEDDKLIYYLKLAKWTERAIHEKFVAEGHTNYNVKPLERALLACVVLSWRKITSVSRKALLFGSRMSRLATEQIEKGRLDLEQRKWKLVPECIQKRESLAMYPAEACCERSEAMTSGGGSHGSQNSPDPKVARLRHERLQQVELLERFKRNENL
ncbi:hypothetical protein TSTA_027450 [Talaromyces stipitatus ATCC 10500]|uniref:DUF7626 domain-containing protein n=1 Tax=Talaromyces stipitatus (strain ATCC 10500 / CBS 375.48 / QM 6759 / NRRL 1006) TaxID=441959 RepID=B8M6I8_TALSN|nr:uncharacterized protein TSTA_027450 [Talaromyces stipitatus ATCC 10500]EED19450.1 hypothetical protein TSTA_027450 [Talaromyces stipitatus ATCC 10500]